MAHGTPDQVAARWAQGLSAAGQKITDGVNAVTTSPGQLAARQKSAYVANVSAAADKWAGNVSKVTTEQWRADMINKGIPRIATGANAAQPKMTQFLTQFLPFVDSAAASLPSRGTYEQNKARAVAMMDKVHQFKRQ